MSSDILPNPHCTVSAPAGDGERNASSARNAPTSPGVYIIRCRTPFARPVGSSDVLYVGSAHSHAVRLRVWPRRHHADLLQERHDILLRPFLHQLAVRDTVDRDGRYLHLVAGARCTGQI